MKTLWDKEKLLVTSNFSFSHCVFKTLVLQTRENQGLFGKRLPVFHTILCFNDPEEKEEEGGEGGREEEGEEEEEEKEEEKAEEKEEGEGRE